MIVTRKMVILTTIFCGIGYSQVLIDSLFFEYTLWTQMHEAISYNPLLDVIEIANIGYYLPLRINVHSAPGDFSFWIHDENVFAGSGLKPALSALAATNPYISFRVGSGMMAQQCAGWFTSNWQPAVDIDPDDIAARPVMVRQLLDSNILFIGTTPFKRIVYRTWSADLQTLIATGTVDSNCFYWGADFNGGIAYVFYSDTNANIYYRTTTDGINWSAVHPYNLVRPQPYTNNIIFWRQTVVTDAGNPILIFHIINGDEYYAGGGTTYPWQGKVYISNAPGANCIEVGQTAAGVRNFYPTIATSGNYVVALFLGHRSGNQLNTFWDIYYNYSTDNGTTWHTPVCLTTDITEHTNSLPQIAKRLNASTLLVVASSISGLGISPIHLTIHYTIALRVVTFFLVTYMSVGIRLFLVLQKPKPKTPRESA